MLRSAVFVALLSLLAISTASANDYGGWLLNNPVSECFFIDNAETFGEPLYVFPAVDADNDQSYGPGEPKRADSKTCYPMDTFFGADNSSKKTGAYSLIYSRFGPYDRFGSHYMHYFSMGFMYGDSNAQNEATGANFSDVAEFVDKEIAVCDIRKTIQLHLNVKKSIKNWNPEDYEEPLIMIDEKWILKDGRVIPVPPEWDELPQSLREQKLNGVTDQKGEYSIRARYAAELIGCEKVFDAYVNGKASAIIEEFGLKWEGGPRGWTEEGFATSSADTIDEDIYQSGVQAGSDMRIPATPSWSDRPLSFAWYLPLAGMTLLAAAWYGYRRRIKR